MEKSIGEGLPMPSRLWAIIAVSMTIGMSCLDINIVNVALPALAVQFRVSASSAIWLINIYQLAIISTILVFSTLGDIYGLKKVYLTGIVIFVASSVACVLSPSFSMLTVSRAFQGIGAAMLTGVNQGQLRYIYPKNKLATGMGINAMVVSCSTLAAPSLASTILSIATWHWLFIINIPLGITAYILGRKYLPKQEFKINAKFDYFGAIANMLTFGLLIFSLEGYSHGEPLHLIAIQLALFSVILFFYVKHELHKEVPLLPLDLFRIPIISMSVCTSICSFSAQMLMTVSMPFLLLNGLHFNIMTTGALLTAWPIATMITAPISGIMVDRFNQSTLGFIGLIIMSSSLFSLTIESIHPSFWNMFIRMFLCGSGFALFQTPNNNTIVINSPPSRSGAASGLIGTARVTGQTIGAALVAFFFSMNESVITNSDICLRTAASIAALGAILSITRSGMRNKSKV
jgi:MFS transporter, DHA2 family, multidrug resistance protein